MLTATAGNVLGSVITWGMGRFGRQALARNEKAERRIRRAEAGVQRMGQPSLLLAWLPVVGDPLCLVAGVLRVPWLNFVLLVTVGKLARYAALAWLV